MKKLTVKEYEEMENKWEIHLSTCLFKCQDMEVSPENLIIILEDRLPKTKTRCNVVFHFLRSRKQEWLWMFGEVREKFPDYDKWNYMFTGNRDAAIARVEKILPKGMVTTDEINRALGGLQG